MAGAIHQALNMPATERRRRMNRMRSVVEINNVYRWAAKIVLTLSDIEVGDAGEQATTADEGFLAGATA